MIRRIILPVFVFMAAAHGTYALRPIADDFVLVDQSPDLKNIPLYNPAILVLPSGRILVSSERAGTWRAEQRAKGLGWAYIRLSDDKGLTWEARVEIPITHGRFFAAGNSIYFLGHDGDLKIVRSDDEGLTWSSPKTLASGSWHQSACNVLHRNGYIYLVMERTLYSGVSGWAALAPVLMRARESDDLTLASSWTFARNELCFADIIEGFRENDPQLGSFGIPFFTQTFPSTNFMNPKRPMHPMGWFETNIAFIDDEKHPLCDPSGKSIHLLMRTHTGGSGFAGIAKVVENDDGTMQTYLETSESGAEMIFLPMPGGQMRFHLLYDHESRLYWHLGSQTTSTMTRLERLDPDWYNLPYNERQRLVLHYSADLIHWQFAGIVAISEGLNTSRHYACMDIDGDDLVILSRSGDSQAFSAHNGNLITFHRVRNFRELVY